MALKRKLATLEGVDDAIKALYAEQKEGDKTVYVLKPDFLPEGMVDSSKLDEFRTNNINLQNELKKFEGVDLEEVKKLQAEAAKNRDKKLLDAGKVDELVQARTAEMKDKYESQLKKSGDSNAALQARLEELELKNVAIAAATEQKALTSAIPDIVSRVRNVFSYEGGKLLPKKDGNVWYGDDGVTPLTIEQYVEKLSVEATHLFNSSSGSGASNQSGSHGGGPSKNPYAKDTLNFTEQGRLEKSNPQLAARLRKEAASS